MSGNFFLTLLFLFFKLLVLSLSVANKRWVENIVFKGPVLIFSWYLAFSFSLQTEVEMRLIKVIGSREFRNDLNWCMMLISTFRGATPDSGLEALKLWEEGIDSRSRRLISIPFFSSSGQLTVHDFLYKKLYLMRDNRQFKIPNIPFKKTNSKMRILLSKTFHHIFPKNGLWE